MDPPPSMVRGNVALIGDAAHPLLPFTSQGANSALEDAALLAHALERSASEAQVEAAFERYNAARHAVMMRYVEAGRAIAASFVQPITDRIPLPLVTA
jgi:2-polyprenyl-6-methoxyphenol hydroxylase-like FAD-dependent oxidoreductase